MKKHNVLLAKMQAGHKDGCSYLPVGFISGALNYHEL